MVKEELKKLIDDSTVICFDIFDTLVGRSCPPDYTKEAWSYYLSELLSRHQESSSFLNQRKTIEQDLCSENLAKHHEAEFRYNDFVERFFDFCRPGLKKDEFADLCVRLETSIEKRVQHVNPDIVDILKYCKTKKKTLVCVSDMYLSNRMLQEILTHHGIAEFFDAIYVSNEAMKSKRSGSFYDFIKNEYKNQKYLMLGNNFDVDIKNAQNHGFSAFHLDSSTADAQYALLAKTVFNSTGSLDKARLFMATSNQNVCFNELKLLRFLSRLDLELFRENTTQFDFSGSADFLVKRFAIVRNESWLMPNQLAPKTSDIKISILRQPESKLTLSIESHNSELYSVNIDTTLLDFEIFIELAHILINRPILFLDSLQNLPQLKNNQTDNVSLSSRKRAYLSRLGESYAPIFQSFAKWIKTNCEKEGIEKIYFFTREGEFFKSIFDIAKGSKIQSEILEVSRVATFCASLREVSLKEFMRVWNQYSKQSMLAFCKTISVSPYLLLPFFDKYRISLSEEIIFPWQDPRIISMFKDEQFIETLSKQISSKRKLILEYFAKKGLKNTEQKIAIVDIGWRGTIQDNICYILDKVKIFGLYLGLEIFLNEQPSNATKQGFVNQFRGGDKIIKNVTPLEMICNSPNGSTIGYSRKPKIHAIRKIDKEENRSFYSCSEPIQTGIISWLKANKTIQPISSGEIYQRLSKLIFEPDKNIARAYFKLKHNEEFGSGEYMFKKRSLHLAWGIAGILSRKHREAFLINIFDSTWPQGFLADKNLSILNKYRKRKNINLTIDSEIVPNNKTIAWVIPSVIPGSGGHRTIVQNANALVRAGYSCDIYTDNDFVTTSSQMKNRIIGLFGECLCGVYVGYDFKKPYDLAVATYSETTPSIVDRCPTKNKAYFIQDFEPWFVPMGDKYIKMEESYRYDFKGVCIGRWLSHKIKDEYGKEVKYFPFCADLNVYHPLKNVKREQSVCFIFQPEKPRRCWELGIKALEIVKALRPKTTIYLYGSADKCPISFEHHNLHIISPESCNELYNKCQVGLCISASNPSRIPFEMIASGLPVVDLFRENNLYDMPDTGVLLAESTPESIATAIVKILDDKNLAASMSKQGHAYMQDYPLEKGFARLLSIIDSMFLDEPYLETSNKKPLYNRPAIVSSDEARRVSGQIPDRTQSISRGEILRRKTKHLAESIWRRAKKVVHLK